MAAPTQAVVEQFMKSYELKPGSINVLTFDVNIIDRKTLRETADLLFQRHGIELYMLGYDALSNESPIQLFEVKR